MASTIQTPQFKSVIMLNHDLISNKLKFGSNMTFHVRDVAWVKGKHCSFLYLLHTQLFALILSILMCQV